jgi:hypothetical protein
MQEKVKIFEVYKVTNKLNSKVYVGITNQGFKQRWYKHCSDSIRGSEFPLHNAIRKYGVDNFSIEVLEICNTSEELKSREQYWISILNSKVISNLGYNVTDGGDGTFGVKHSDETKEKIRQKAFEREISDITRYNMSMNSSFAKEISMFTLDGEFIKTFRTVKEASLEIGISSTNIASCARGNYKQSGGYKWSYTGKLPEKQSLKIESKEVKPKVKRVTSEEVKKRISETNKLRWTDERKVKQSIENTKNRIILQYTLDGEFVKEYYNVSEAVKAVGASTHTNIAKCARGIRKKACGFVWKYKDN